MNTFIPSYVQLLPLTGKPVFYRKPDGATCCLWCESGLNSKILWMWSPLKFPYVINVLVLQFWSDTVQCHEECCMQWWCWIAIKALLADLKYTYLVLNQFWFELRRFQACLNLWCEYSENYPGFTTMRVWNAIWRGGEFLFILRLFLHADGKVFFTD